MKKRFVIAGYLAAAVVMATGCFGKKIDKTITMEAEKETEAERSKKEKSGEKGREKEETLDEAAARELDQQLYDAYIEVNNVMLGSLAEAIDSYFEDVKFQEKFSTVEKEYQCLPVGSEVYDAIKKANKLVGKKPEEDELDQAFLELYPVMKELAQALDEVHEYTDSESYKEDKYAKGRALHKAVWYGYEEYKTLGNAFIDKLGDKGGQQDTAALEELKESGLEATYAFNVMINTAQEIQRGIMGQGITDAKVIDLDIDVLQSLYDQYMNNVQVCLDHLEDEEAMAAEGYPESSDHYRAFETAIKDSQTALSGLFRRVREQKPVDESDLDSDTPGDGTIRKFDSSVNNLINEYNRLISGEG